MGNNNQGREVLSSCYCPSLVEDFEDLVDDLAPSPSYLKQCRKIRHEIFEILRQNSGSYDIRIDRTKQAGSLAKNTGISYYDEDGHVHNPDSDLVVFINDEEPPFPECLDAFVDILTRSLEIDDVSKTSISVQFTYHSPAGDIEFDLLPASNFITELKPNEDPAEVAGRRGCASLRKQFKRKVRADLNKMYSTSFCEKSVNLLKSYTDDPFYRNVVRLAKFWNSQLELDMYISARSFMMELIAIDCQIGKSRKCIVSGFRRFLEAMADFKNIQVEIGNPQVKPNDPYYLQVKRSKGPLVMDPVNPYNNLAHDIDRKAISVFMKQAKITLDILDEVKSTNGYDNFRGKYENAIDEIFYHKH